jgi:hypothetical protein
VTHAIRFRFSATERNPAQNIIAAQIINLCGIHAASSRIFEFFRVAMRAQQAPRRAQRQHIPSVAFVLSVVPSWSAPGLQGHSPLLPAPLPAESCPQTRVGEDGTRSAFVGGSRATLVSLCTALEGRWLTVGV